MSMKGHLVVGLCLLVLVLSSGALAAALKSEKLCSQCSKCESSKCPPSEAYPHMTAFDDSLIAAALQSDYVALNDRGVYSIPSIKSGQSTKHNVYFGWESSSGSASGYHRFNNYMDKCSDEKTYLTVDKHGKVSMRPLSSLHSLAEADWKSINPPKKLNHREFRYWVSNATGKCLTICGGDGKLRTLGVADCKFDGSNHGQLFAFRFHYHNAFCCCGVHNT